MKIDITEVNGTTVAEITAKGVIINKVDDALDILGNCGYLGASKIIIHEKNLNVDFFDLKTTLAGDILQKFSNYNMKLAIVGNYEKFTSKSLHDFIYESNKAGRITFVSSVEEAKTKQIEL